MQDGWGRDGKRGSNRYERIPTALCGRVDLRTPADYAAYFLPQEPTAFPDGYFTAAGYAASGDGRPTASCICWKSWS